MFVQSQSTWPLANTPDFGLQVSITDKAALIQTTMTQFYSPAGYSSLDLIILKLFNFHWV